MAEPIVRVDLDLETKEAEKKLDSFKEKAAKSGQDGGDLFSGSFKKSISSLSIAIAGVAAAGAALLGIGLKKSIEEAIKQENAVNALNRSLAASGQFSKLASQNIQDFASTLSNTTAIGGDVILQNAALIQSLAKLDELGLKRATTAALDLSAALGISFEQASSLVAKAANGNVSAFQRYGIAIDQGSNKNEAFANTLRALEASFGGAAAGKLNTFQGQLTRTADIFDSIFESIGLNIIQSKVFVALIKTVGDSLAEFAKKVSSVDLTSFLSIDNVIAFGTALNNFVVAPLELVFNVARAVIGGINTIVSGFVALTGQRVGIIADLLNKIGIDNKVTQGLQTFRESSKEVFEGIASDTKESVDKIFEGTVFGKGEEFIESLRLNLENAKSAIEESGIKNAIQPKIEEGESGDFFANFTAGFTQAEITLANFAQKTKEFGTQIRNNLQSGIANGSAQAFASFGAALANGDDALGAFTQTFLNAIGQMAIQQGAAFILQGIAYQFVPGFQGIGAGLIGAGAALAAFGGALSALNSGASASKSSGGGAGGGSLIGGESITDPRTGLSPNQERIQEKQAVSLTIQGNVFDSQETGTAIARILSESFEKNGVVLTNPRFA